MTKSMPLRNPIFSPFIKKSARGVNYYKQSVPAAGRTRTMNRITSYVNLQQLQ